MSSQFKEHNLSSWIIALGQLWVERKLASPSQAISTFDTQFPTALCQMAFAQSMTGAWTYALERAACWAMLTFEESISHKTLR
ncbi:hypothetical protein MJO29_009004 [Puccinia striiformis f. sp. tritici]|nr:hypothetical protein MJO29_009004 [Puccinia striiformis f. sp. tritici]